MLAVARLAQQGQRVASGGTWKAWGRAAPVGTQVHRGRAAVEAFYRGGVGAITRTTLLGPPVVASEGPGAIAFRVDLQLPDRAIALEVIDVMGFDAAGRFTSMRAFWGRDNRLLP